MHRFARSASRRLFGNKPHDARSRRRRASLECLETRNLLAASAFYDPVKQALAIVGTSLSDGAIIKSNGDGAILLNNVPTGATLANTKSVQISMGSGADVVTLNFGKAFVSPEGDEVKFT